MIWQRVRISLELPTTFDELREQETSFKTNKQNNKGMVVVCVMLRHHTTDLSRTQATSYFLRQQLHIVSLYPHT